MIIVFCINQRNTDDERSVLKLHVCKKIQSKLVNFITLMNIKFLY